MSRESHPVLLTRFDVQFQIVRGFQQIPRDLWRNSMVKDREQAAQSVEAMIEIVLKRFDGLEVYRGLPAGEPFPGLAN